jgi:hypothetical protein
VTNLSCLAEKEALLNQWKGKIVFCRSMMDVELKLHAF